jgi:hypothetical protein
MKITLLSSFLFLISSITFSQTRDIDKAVLTQKEQAELYNKNLEWKLDNVLLPVMRREKIDMWLIICFENSEDPVYRTLTTWPLDNARRLSILIFHDAPGGLKKLAATWHGAAASGYMYESIFTDKSFGPEGQFKAVADYIRKADPKSIGINYNNEIIDDFSHANGLSHFHYEKLYNALDPKYRDRLVSAKNAEGLNPVMYSHPVNYFGHGSGMTIGVTENQKFLKGSGEHTLFNNTTYALEFSVSAAVAEWNNEAVSQGFEEDIIFTGGKAMFADGRQEKLYLIK